MNVIIVMSEAATRAVLRAVEDDPDRSKWGHHQWVRSEAIHALSASLVRPEDALAKALYRMNGSAWYGRDLGDWDDPESRIGRNPAERDRWYRQADALKRSGACAADRSPSAWSAGSGRAEGEFSD